MTTQVTPASLVEKRDWTMLSISKNCFQNSETESITVSYHATLTNALHKFLGTPAGEPQLIVSMNNNMQTRFIDQDEIKTTDVFGELLTRADGSTITFLDLLEEKMTAAIPAQPNQTPSV